MTRIGASLLITTAAVFLQASFQCMAAAEIGSVAIYDLLTDERVPVRQDACRIAVGARYKIEITVRTDSPVKVFVEPALPIPLPTGVVIHNKHSDTEELTKTSNNNSFTFFLMTMAQCEFPLVFQLVDAAANERAVLHEHAGISIHAMSEAQGIYGTIRSIETRRPILGATVTLSNGSATRTDDRGAFQFKDLGGNTFGIVVSKAGYSDYRVVNIPYTGDGERIDCLLEKQFLALRPRGIQYCKYDDRSQGSTIMHIVNVPRTGISASIVEATSSRKNAFPHFETSVEIGKRTKSLIVLNGGYFDLPTATSAGNPFGYFYANGHRKFTPFSWQGRFPVLGILDSSQGHVYQIKEKTASLTTSDWGTSNGHPIWDDSPRDGTSDVTYALQCDPVLLRTDGTIPSQFAPDQYKHWARTAVGIDASGNLILLVADGEGLHGCQGASMPQMASFFKNVLKAESAINLDGGGSTQLAIAAQKDPQLVNTLTAEHPRWLSNGRVQNYLLIR